MRRREEEPTHAKIWLSALLSQYSEHNKGELYVSRVLEACACLKEKGFIEGFEVTKKNSSFDIKGIDVIVQRNGGVEFLQVTSTLDNGYDHIKRQKQYPERPSVSVIYVREGNKPLLKSVDNLQREIAVKLEKGPKT